MRTILMTMQDILHSVPARIMAASQACLSYPETADVPPAFNRLALTDFAVLSEADENLEWEDYCAAYAFGLLSFEACLHGAARHSEATLKAQWEALRGQSRLDWQQARAIIARSWNALVRLERGKCLSS